ncbi:MAG: hypothetical protein DMD81_04220 [Candidatus Rokuibacteriota bacterium]|nr:MAG: hypothetical protein DMD81_04220 [Candidatus Rokubacteria bacterium]
MLVRPPARSRVTSAPSGAAPGRRSADEITVFKSVGLAVEDVVAADLVYRKITGPTGVTTR